MKQLGGLEDLRVFILEWKKKGLGGLYWLVVQFDLEH
jgi:hypothetical protein